MATIYIDGHPYKVDEQDNLLQACLSLGLDLPYFCWHPAMGSVGACRQCAVIQYKDEHDTEGALTMACMTPAQDQTRISIKNSQAREFRSEVIEWLMINHPHDCPVCEEGGHCHLQDMTVMTGHDRRRYRFRKRTHRNQDLGPFIAHEMNRCITCYRCVRFYNDYAGGEDLGAFGANDNVYFGRYDDGTLESPFSGNLTEVCPTGVFTDQTHSERYTRKWDLMFAPSVCHQCAVGCNTSPGERYGSIRRIENRYNGSVNRYFLCDRGRFGYGYVNRDDRPLVPRWRESRSTDPVDLSVDAALDRAGDLLRQSRRIIGIGSPRASLESNHQLRLLVGAENFSTGIAAQEWACVKLMETLNRECGLTTPTLREVEDHDAVLVLGEDLIESAARVGLSVRQAVLGRQFELAEERGIPEWNAEAVKTLGQDAGHPLYTVYPTRTGLDGIAAGHWSLAPDDIARFGFAVAHAIDPKAPEVPDLDEATREAAARIAQALLDAHNPLVISGGSLLSTSILEAAGSVAHALAKREGEGSLMLVRREANTTGLGLMGGHALEWALETLHHRDADAVVILENDLYQRLPAEQVDPALGAADAVVVLDHQTTRTLDRADLAFPAASFAEGDGTLVSLEGRAQRFYQVYDPVYQRPQTRIHESWRWLHAIRNNELRHPVADINLDAATEACAMAHPALSPLQQTAPDSDYRVDGMRYSRAPHRYSGRTAMRANLDVSEPRPEQDPDTPFAFSMEGYYGHDRPRRDVPFAWAPGWNSPQAWNKFTDEVGGHLSGGDPGVRLIEPSGHLHRYSTQIPAPFQPREGQWQVCILPRLFGGEETSSRAEPIQKRATEPSICLNGDDLATVSTIEGHRIDIKQGELMVEMRVKVDDSLPPGVVGFPAGVETSLIHGTWVHLATKEGAS